MLRLMADACRARGDRRRSYEGPAAGMYDPALTVGDDATLQIVISCPNDKPHTPCSARRPRPSSAISSSWQGWCLARSATCEPSLGRPGHGRRRACPSASASWPGRQPRGGRRPPPGTRLQRGRPVARLARLCCELVAQTGGFLSGYPLRAQEADKNGLPAAGYRLAHCRCCSSQT